MVLRVLLQNIYTLNTTVLSHSRVSGVMCIQMMVNGTLTSLAQDQDMEGLKSFISHQAL